MTFFTIQLTPSGNGFILNPNDLLNAPGTGIDYRAIKQPLTSVIRLVLEENEADGINILFVDGTKVNLKKELVSQVGAVSNFPTNEVLLDSIITLLGW